MSGVETFNAVNSYDFELPDHYLEELVLEIAQMAGINLRDQLVSTLAQGEQNERSKEVKVFSNISSPTVRFLQTVLLIVKMRYQDKVLQK